VTGVQTCALPISLKFSTEQWRDFIAATLAFASEEPNTEITGPQGPVHRPVGR